MHSLMCTLSYIIHRWSCSHTITTWRYCFDDCRTCWMHAFAVFIWWTRISARKCMFSYMLIITATIMLCCMNALKDDHGVHYLHTTFHVIMSNTICYLFNLIYVCSQPSTFISAILLIAGTMLRLALPHVNVLSKVDLLSHYGPLPFNFDFFTELADLTPLIR